jgi:hypothetical protein
MSNKLNDKDTVASNKIFEVILNMDQLQKRSLDHPTVGSYTLMANIATDLELRYYRTLLNYVSNYCRVNLLPLIVY